MTWLGRLWARIRRWRRISAAKADKTPLREFVYLDEVSVYSLLASRKGPLATEYTDTQEVSQSGELGSSIGANTGIAKANTSSKFTSTQTQSSQVLRKSTIQAAFKELREGEEGKLAIEIIPAASKPPRVTAWADLENMISAHASDEQWIIDSDLLTRGRLFEMTVELESDKVFRMTAIINAMRDIVQQNQELFPIADYQNIQTVEAINRVLDSLLVGLIPLRCRAVDYQVLHLKGKKLLVHKRILDQLPSDSRYSTEALFIVGVTEQRLFWKDIRRVLFSGLQFHMMCRANHDGLRDTWVPVKLFDVLRDVIPGLAKQLDAATRAAFDSGEQPASRDEAFTASMTKALIRYGLDLAEHLGGQVGVEAVSEVVAGLHYGAHEYEDIEVRRKAFGAITDYVTSKLGADSVDPMVIAQLRTIAQIDAGATILGSDSTLQATTASSVPADGDAASVIDTEIVAIYW